MPLRRNRQRPRAAAVRAFFRLPGSSSLLFALALFVAVAAAATVILAVGYRREGEDISFVEALYAALNLMFFNTVYPLGDDALSRAVFFAVPVLGLVVLGQFLVRLGTALLNREQWERAVASTYTDHVIVCGLGRVGFRVVRWLLDLGERVVVVENDAANLFVEQVRSWGVPVVAADARRAEILRQAGVERASVVAALTSDDVLNLSIATEARALRPDLRVVLRTFEDRLAENLRSGFDIHAAYSASSLAAPAFAAAAARVPVDHAFAVGEDRRVLITVTKFTLVPESVLVGRTIGQVEDEFGVDVIAHRGAAFELHPPLDRVLAAGEGFVVSGPTDALSRIAQLTPPTRFLRRYEEGRWPLTGVSGSAGEPGSGASGT